MAGEKRTQEQEETLLSETVVLVDIEGTTTSISFVKETLFPYVRENLKKYIESKWEDEEFKKDFEMLKEQAKKDEENKVDGFVPITGSNPEEQRESLLKNILWQMDDDRKTGALKQLQGHIWREAYKSGAIKGHVYEDVPKAFESWTNDGRKIYVYSSGSVEAQKLLFGHSINGDLLKYFSGFFDTEVGLKQERNSYKNIVSKIGMAASSIIFLTDIVKEAEAAKEAGLTAVIVLREGNAALTNEEKTAFTTIKSFLDLTFQTSSKRQKIETSESEESTNKPVTDVSEPMDTSEDVEMSDVSEKKTEKTGVNEVIESEQGENTKAQLQEEAKTLTARKEEAMITDTKEASETEKPLENKVEIKADSEAKSSETGDKPDAGKSAAVSESASASVENDTKKSQTSEKTDNGKEATEKANETAPVEVNTIVKDSMDTGTQEPKSKSEPMSVTTEKKTEETVHSSNETNSMVTQKADAKTTEMESTEKTSEKGASDKPEECIKPVKDETKDESPNKTTSDSNTMEKSEAESAQKTKPAESAKVEETTASDATENGEAPSTTAEKTSAIPESESKDSKADVKSETKELSDAGSEKTVEKEKEPEKVDDSKSPKEKQTEETAGTTTADTEKSGAETSKQEQTKEESVKEETLVDEVKDKSTVDTEKKKLNGTTQNGDTDVPVSDDKLHRNGLNEGSTSEKLNSAESEDVSAQNGEPESSSETSAESIKVKKVVDSTVADGAGEPDVVPPVVVAATS